MTQLRELRKHVADKMGSTDLPAIPIINQWVARAKQADLAEMHDSGIIWHHGLVSELSITFMPPGFYMVEHPLNGMVVGVQMPVLPITHLSLQRFSDLVEMSNKARRPHLQLQYATASNS